LEDSPFDTYNVKRAQGSSESLAIFSSTILLPYQFH
jgi:hypothetical protein